ncbi:hypothetical protein [Erythrobacter colymbi]|uniref:hypothetical protein n=1 Tax=Erythrobacter colymbi TaxID=1161202 RepID=UPI00117E1750|nr:hypothetical protein [Erythrobacter colymbi]
MYVAARTMWLVLILLLQGCMNFAEDETNSDRPTETGFNVGQRVSNEMATPASSPTSADEALFLSSLWPAVVPHEGLAEAFEGIEELVA